MIEYEIEQTEADKIMLSIQVILQKAGNLAHVIDFADTDEYIAAAHTSHLYAGHLLIKRRIQVVDYRKLVH